MRYTEHHLRSAPVAIAAMLALGSTSALAQGAPASPAPSAPADPIVLQLPIAPQAAPSPTSAETVAPSPAAQPVQQPTITLDLPPAPAGDTAAEPAPAQPVTTTRASSAEPRPAPQRSEPAPASSAPAPVAASTAVGPDTPTSSAAQSSSQLGETAAPPPAAVGALESAPNEVTPGSDPDWVALIALALAGLIPITLAFLAFAWFRRRSRRVGELDAEAVTPERAPEPAASVPVAKESVETAAAPTPAPVRSHPLDSYRGLPKGGAAVALPAELPRTFEERDALLKRMIAAKPDRANPFRSPRARAKRARLILQSLGRKFENAKPRIDLSEYTANWPALARKRTAYA